MKSDQGHQSPGSRDNFPVFAPSALARLTYPLAWDPNRFPTYDTWRCQARAKVMECLLAAPPPAPFEPAIIAEEDRGNYVVRKLTVQLTADSRVLGYLAVPKGEGPFPAVLALHDHGGFFEIGKEKVVRPFGVPDACLRMSEDWVNRCYGGRWFMDALAARGYLCFATDMFNWGDRGGGGHAGQEALSCTLLHLGMSFSGLIAHEDLRSAEFVATLPEVDSRRVAAVGLSVGGFRTWQIAALSDRLAAGCSICWMATMKGILLPRTNQTSGGGVYTLIHPDIFNYLDYPNVASIACPKPMLFFGGMHDELFPPSCVEEAYAKMRSVWTSQGADNRLVTKLWDVPHEFNVAMQNEAFDWLDAQCRPRRGD